MVARRTTCKRRILRQSPGSPWRDLPSRYGPHTTVYNRYNRWSKAGVWLRVFEALSATSPQSMHLIDSSIIRAHQHVAGLHPAWLTGENEVGYEATGRDEPFIVGSAASMRKEGEAKRSSVARSQSSMRLPSDTTP